MFHKHRDVHLSKLLIIFGIDQLHQEPAATTKMINTVAAILARRWIQLIPLAVIAALMEGVSGLLSDPRSAILVTLAIGAHVSTGSLVVATIPHNHIAEIRHTLFLWVLVSLAGVGVLWTVAGWIVGRVFHQAVINRKYDYPMIFQHESKRYTVRGVSVDKLWYGYGHVVALVVALVLFVAGFNLDWIWLP